MFVHNISNMRDAGCSINKKIYNVEKWVYQVNFYTKIILTSPNYSVNNVNW